MLCICDELDLNCDVTVTPVLTNLCEGDWLVYLDFVYTTEVSDLDNVNVIITSLSTGNVFAPEIASVSLNSLYDVAYIINTPGDYLISFSETPAKSAPRSVKWESGHPFFQIERTEFERSLSFSLRSFHTLAEMSMQVVK